jgi:hypothetical protein
MGFFTGMERRLSSICAKDNELKGICQGKRWHNRIGRE